MSDVSASRDRMVSRQIAARGIRDPAVLSAMRAVKRDAFVPETLVEFAYEDSPLPIGEGQTISQPYIVAAMIAALARGTEERREPSSAIPPVCRGFSCTSLSPP